MVRKGKNILIGTLIVYGILVATHLGEFWPFSIYPMFSQAGNPWTRSLVREIPDSEWNDWQVWNQKEELPGSQFALNQVGINQNDLANFISKNTDWPENRIRGLRKYFSSEIDDSNFLVFKVRGALSPSNPDSVVLEYTPYIFISKDTTIFNPEVQR